MNRKNRKETWQDFYLLVFLRLVEFIYSRWRHKRNATTILHIESMWNMFCCANEIDEAKQNETRRPTSIESLCVLFWFHLRWVKTSLLCGGRNQQKKKIWCFAKISAYQRLCTTHHSHDVSVASSVKEFKFVFSLLLFFLTLHFEFS